MSKREISNIHPAVANMLHEEFIVGMIGCIRAAKQDPEFMRQFRNRKRRRRYAERKAAAAMSGDVL
jgi:hypothetical protein